MGTHPIFESDFDCLTDIRSSICLLISIGMSNGDESKRNITDTETPVLEEVALEEKLKNMKLDLADLDNGISVPELAVILENSDVNDPYLHLKQLPHDRSATILISFTFDWLLNSLQLSSEDRRFHCRRRPTATKSTLLAHFPFLTFITCSITVCSRPMFQYFKVTLYYLFCFHQAYCSATCCVFFV